MSIVGTGRFESPDQDLLRTVAGQIGGDLRPLITDAAWDTFTDYTRTWMTDPDRREKDLQSGLTIQQRISAELERSLDQVFRVQIPWLHRSNAVAMDALQTEANVGGESLTNFPVRRELREQLGEIGRVTFKVITLIDRIIANNDVRLLAILTPEQMASVACGKGLSTALRVPDLRIVDAPDIAGEASKQRVNKDAPCVAWTGLRFLLPGKELPKIDEPFPEARAFVVSGVRANQQIHTLTGAIRSYNQQIRIGNQDAALAAIDTKVDALRQSRQLEAINAEIDETSEQLREFLSSVQRDILDILKQERGGPF